MIGDFFDDFDFAGWNPAPGTATMYGQRSDGAWVAMPFQYHEEYACCWRCGDDIKLCAEPCGCCDVNRRRKLCWACIVDLNPDDSWWWQQNVVPPHRLHALVRRAA